MHIIIRGNGANIIKAINDARFDNTGCHSFNNNKKPYFPLDKMYLMAFKLKVIRYIRAVYFEFDSDGMMIMPHLLVV